MDPIMQHHYDTITEKLALNRLKADQAEQDEEQPPAAEQAIEQRPSVPDPAYLAAVLRRRQAMQARLDDAKIIFEEVNTEAVHLLTQQYEATRSVKADITLDGKTKFATVTRVGGESEAQVTDRGRFQEWVRDTYPEAFDFRVVPARTEITIDAQFEADLLAQVTAAGAAKYVDKETGEIHEVPGVAIRGTRKAYFRWLFTRKSKSQPLDGRALVAQAVQGGRLDLDEPLALAPAPGADAGGGAA